MSTAEMLHRTGEFEITSTPRGNFLHIKLQGRFTDEVLGAMQKHVFSQKKSLGIDVGGLSGATMAFARAVLQGWQTGKTSGWAVALINPNDMLRDFFRLIDSDHRIAILLSETQLPQNEKDLPGVAEKLERELQQFRRELESNAMWQFCDREFCWICPFCGEMRDNVRLGQRHTVGQAAVDLVWRHLNFQCATYTPARPKYLAREDLETKVKKLNEEKFAASRDQADALRGKVHKLEEKKEWAENMEKGVRIAASRQRRLLPTTAPTVPGCEISFTYRPAEELSGDFYDFVELPEGRVAFVIGDVSGHGIEAGILMGMTKKVLSIRLSEIEDVAEAMRRANADIQKDLDRTSFVTAVAVVFDPKARMLTYARAGHNPPLLFSPSRGGGSRLEAGGMVLGKAAAKLFDAGMKAETVPVQPGDALLLYTDGIEEGKNTSGEEFGEERLGAILQAEVARPAAFILGALFHEYDKFVGGGAVQEDDHTAVCIKFS